MCTRECCDGDALNRVVGVALAKVGGGQSRQLATSDSKLGL